MFARVEGAKAVLLEDGIFEVSVSLPSSCVRHAKSIFVIVHSRLPRSASPEGPPAQKLKSLERRIPGAAFLNLQHPVQDVVPCRLKTSNDSDHLKQKGERNEPMRVL
jgi:hypothetical protein